MGKIELDNLLPVFMYRPSPSTRSAVQAKLMPARCFGYVSSPQNNPVIMGTGPQKVASPEGYWNQWRWFAADNAGVPGEVNDGIALKSDYADPSHKNPFPVGFIWAEGFFGPEFKLILYPDDWGTFPPTSFVLTARVLFMDGTWFYIDQTTTGMFAPATIYDATYHRLIVNIRMANAPSPGVINKPIIGIEILQFYGVAAGPLDRFGTASIQVKNPVDYQRVGMRWGIRPLPMDENGNGYFQWTRINLEASGYKPRKPIDVVADPALSRGAF